MLVTLTLLQGNWIPWSVAKGRMLRACPNHSLLEFLARATAGRTASGCAMLRCDSYLGLCGGDVILPFTYRYAVDSLIVSGTRLAHSDVCKCCTPLLSLIFSF